MLRVAEHAERTDTGRHRRTNEDAYVARAPLFVVADGMGGAQAGEVAVADRDRGPVGRGLPSERRQRRGAPARRRAGRERAHPRALASPTRATRGWARR